MAYSAKPGSSARAVERQEIDEAVLALLRDDSYTLDELRNKVPLKWRAKVAGSLERLRSRNMASSERRWTLCG